MRAGELTASVRRRPLDHSATLAARDQQIDMSAGDGNRRFAGRVDATIFIFAIVWVKRCFSHQRERDVGRCYAWCRAKC